MMNSEIANKREKEAEARELVMLLEELNTSNATIESLSPRQIGLLEETKGILIHISRGNGNRGSSQVSSNLVSVLGDLNPDNLRRLSPIEINPVTRISEVLRRAAEVGLSHQLNTSEIVQSPARITR